MNPLDTSELIKARNHLLDGEVVAIPTETVYGLAASIGSEKGLRQVFAVKERPFFDPLIVHVASLKEAAKVAKEWTPLTDFLTRSFWPGPFTVVVPKAEHISSLITSGLDTVAIRYPSHPLALDLIKLVGTPLAAPSANKFGRTSPSRVEHVRSEFPTSSFMILDGGACEIGLESTVVAVSEGLVEILRPGAITEEMIHKALAKWSNPVRVERRNSEASPGHLKHHYMPRIPLIIVSSDEPDGLSSTTRKKIAEKLSPKFKGLVSSPAELVLNEDPVVAARELYSEMRRLAESGADLIYVRHPGSEKTRELWEAIWDRLTRAAGLCLVDL